MALCQFSESFRIYFDKIDSGFDAIKMSMKFEHRRHLYIFEQIRNAALIETNDNPMEPSLVNMACEKKKIHLSSIMYRQTMLGQGLP